MDSGFWVSKVIIDLEAKFVNAEALIKKGRYWPKRFTGDLIDTQFEDKEVSNFGIIEARTEESKLFGIFIMKDIDYVMKIMASWMILDESEVAMTKMYFICRSGTKGMNHFTYRQPFSFHLSCRN